MKIIIKGIKVEYHPDTGRVYRMSDWTKADILVKQGYFTSIFYGPATYGHKEYFVVGNSLSGIGSIKDVAKALDKAVKKLPLNLHFKTSVRLQSTETTLFKVLASKKLGGSVSFSFDKKKRPQYESYVSVPFLLNRVVHGNSWNEVFVKAMVEVQKVVDARKLLE